MHKPKEPVRREPLAWEVYRRKGAPAAGFGRHKGAPAAFVGVVRNAAGSARSGIGCCAVMALCLLPAGCHGPAAAEAAVTEMGGHVAKKLGDGLMALFGYPVAQENDAERAARAALAIQRALAELNRKNAGSGKPALNARIGIETGPVVVDAAGEINGDAPNTAARVQALTEPAMNSMSCCG